MAPEEPQTPSSEARNGKEQSPKSLTDNALYKDTMTLSSSALKAFAHPLRQGMHQYIVDHGPQTATMLAKAFQESTGQTSYHLRQLAKHGMIVEAKDHPAKGKERWWDTVGLRADHTSANDPETLVALRSMAAEQVRNHANYMYNWLGSMTAEQFRDLKGVTMNRVTARMTPEESEAMLDEVMETIDKHTERAKERIKEEGEDGTVRMRVYMDAVPLEFGTEPDPGASK